MRLRRIEAVRYGALAGATLGDLGDGLTVVHGPNEAGKSTYTSLVRHVLYRFPTAREVEPGYFVPGDGRIGRLVFEDEAGAWAIERTEGPHGGRVAVRTLAGPDRPSLLDDITRGVSELAYKTVFGFGLGEMAAIEEQRGSGDSIIARLYAASAGLRVSPQEVRAAIEREAAELYKPTGRKPAVNALLAETRKTRAELRELHAQADLFMADQDELRALERRLEEARETRDAARERTTALAVAVERADERLAVIGQQEAELLQLRRQRAQSAEERDAVAVDERLVAAGPEIDALLEDAAAHARELQTLRESETAVVRAETRASDAIGRTGMPADALRALGDVSGALAAVEEAREELQRYRMQLESREDAKRRAVENEAALRERAAALHGELGIDGDGAADQVAERISALDGLEMTLSGGARPVRSGPDLPPLIMTGSGAVAVVTGALLREWSTVAIGAALLVAGIVLVVRAGGRSHAPTSAEPTPFVRAAGLSPDATPLEVSRLRRALEASRAALSAAADAAREAEEAARDASAARDALAAREALWRGWLTERGLPDGITPSAASALLVLVRDAQAAIAAAEEARSVHVHGLEQAAAFAARFVSVAGPLLGLPPELAADDVPVAANRLKEALGAAREAAARQDRLARDLLALDGRILGEEEKLARARTELLEVLERYDLAESGSTEDLRVALERARQVEAEASAAFESLARERHELAGRLESGARERRTGELHLVEAGQSERLSEAVDAYLVRAVASELLAEAQRRYQQERQPDVVRAAGGLLATMTDGRYVALDVPLADGRIEVRDARSGARTSEALSRGTAEQLYLAIRLGLISRLGEVGVGLPVLMDDVLVNFDPQRRRGAAEAIVELAAVRQVVFFTCHPETAALFDEVADGHVRLDIDRRAL